MTKLLLGLAAAFVLATAWADTRQTIIITTALDNRSDEPLLLEAIYTGAAMSPLAFARSLADDGQRIQQVWESLTQQFPSTPQEGLLPVLFQVFREAIEDTNENKQYLLARARAIFQTAGSAARFFRNVLGFNIRQIGRWLREGWLLNANQLADALAEAEYGAVEIVTTVIAETANPAELLAGFLKLQVNNPTHDDTTHERLARLAVAVNPVGGLVKATQATFSIANWLLENSRLSWSRIAVLLVEEGYAKGDTMAWVRSRGIPASDALIFLTQDLELPLADAAQILSDAGYQPPELARALMTDATLDLTHITELLSTVLGSRAAAAQAIAESTSAGDEVFD